MNQYCGDNDNSIENVGGFGLEFVALYRIKRARPDKSQKLLKLPLVLIYTYTFYLKEMPDKED